VRRFEFPWAYDKVQERRRSDAVVVEIGGSLAGLQFVLAQESWNVINVDPGLAAEGLGWEVNADVHRQLCDTLNAPVALRPTTIGQAGIPDGSVDVLLSVSTIEHFAQADIEEFAAHARRILKPDGVAVLTIDLFLDLSPFTSRATNEYGHNVDVRSLLTNAGLELVEGDVSELYGFDEFDADRVQSNLASYFIGDYPAMAQCVVARPADGR
jgi:SAM-dependent methyltransferase